MCSLGIDKFMFNRINTNTKEYKTFLRSGGFTHTTLHFTITITTVKALPPLIRDHLLAIRDGEHVTAVREAAHNG